MDGYVYFLLDPRDGDIRYVGQSMASTDHVLARHHASRFVHISDWINDLRSCQLKPFIIKIEDGLSINERLVRENHWITLGRYVGWPLLNIQTTTTSYPCRCQSCRFAYKKLFLQAPIDPHIFDAEFYRRYVKYHKKFPTDELLIDRIVDLELLLDVAISKIGH